MIQLSLQTIKQNKMLQKSKSSTRITLWEEQRNQLKCDTSYFLNNFMIREFSNQKYLSMLKGDGDIIQIIDI